MTLNIENIDDPASIIVIALVLAFLCAAISVWREVHSASYRNRPQVVLRRCRIELCALKRDLRTLPAGHGMHELLQTIDHAESTMDKVEFEVAGRR